MPPAEGALLEGEGLERSFGARRVLRGINLRVARGDALAVLGPNGAGKTTLLRILAGLTRPSAGIVRVLGRPLERGDPEVRRPIGLLSHQSFLYDDLTLLENLTFAARLYGVASPQTAALAALAEVDLAARAEDRPRSLSRGLQQRASIARALIHRPAVLLLDEPFTGLDASAADRLRGVLLRFREGGGGVVVVTHQAAEAWSVVTRVGVLNQGKWILEETRPSDLGAFSVRYQELISA